MTSKERTLAALRFERPDRCPTFDNFWAEWSESVRERYAIPAGTSIEEHYQVDVMLLFPDEGPYTTRARVVSESDKEKIVITPWGATEREVKGAYFSEELDAPIKTPGDLDKNPFDPPEMESRYESMLASTNYQPDRFCYFVKTGGPYLRNAFIRGTENWLMDIAGDEGFAKELAMRMGRFLAQIGLEALSRWGQYDTGVWIFDDMAYNHGPMFSPASFERVLLPAYAHMVQSWKDAGASFVLLHSDGNIEPLIQMLIDAGIDAFNPVEPRSGMDLVRLHREYRDKAAFIGGMCNSQVLPNGPEEAIHRQARGIVEAGRDGGVIIGAHSIGPDIPIEHYEAYLDEVHSHPYR